MKLCVDCIHVSVCYRQGKVDLNYADKCGDYKTIRKGHWLYKEITDDYRVTGQCSECKERKIIDNFCPNCGADMRGNTE